jgi:hypothetical protein
MWLSDIVKDVKERRRWSRGHSTSRMTDGGDLNQLELKGLYIDDADELSSIERTDSCRD